MAAVAVAADNDRVAVAVIATDAGTWGNDGGGGQVADEPDFFYEGAAAQSRKVSTSRIGRQYLGGTVRDSTVADRTTFLFKINITNYAGLLSRSSPAAGIKIGSSATDYDEWYVFGNDNYPAAGGWQFVAINPAVSGYKDDITNGTPVFTAVDYYSLIADFSATSKGENIVIDAIDLGRGLKLTGGDGADADGLWADFLSADEGTSSGRWGFVRSLAGIFFANGELAIGENTSESAVATVFQDATGQTIVWENGMVATGYHRFRVNLGSATTDVDITGATFDSTGQKDNDGDRGYSTTEDSRLIIEVAGTSGDLKFIGCTAKNLQDLILTSAVTLDACDFETEAMTQAGAEIFDSVIRTTAVTSVAGILNPTFGSSTDIRNTEFIQAGAGHAIELDGIGVTVNLTGITWTGYGATTSDAAAIDVTAASGTTTINWSGGNAPTYKTAGATVLIVNTATLTLSGIKQNSEVRIFTAGTDTELAGIEDVTASEEFDFVYDPGVVDDIDIRIHHLDWLHLDILAFTTAASSAELPIQQVIDRQYENP